MTTKPGFAVQGVSHLALVCSDMKRTNDFYEGVLGLPLTKTMELPGGLGQHFFYDIGNGDCLAFFWFAAGVDAAPGVAFPHNLATPSADGSMHHVAFKIAPEDVESVARHLERHGIDYTFVPHMLPDAMAALTPEQINQMIAEAEHGARFRPELLTDDVFAASYYFKDPDGIVLEYCAWLPAWDQVSREHEPMTAADRRHAAPVA
jgi:catechol 2,3-dioxygenase-like lactoylglutathione lyase family enzyme